MIISRDDINYQKSRHLATPPQVSPRNDVRGTGAEIQYWWSVTTQIWVAFLIGGAWVNFTSTKVL